MQHSAKTPSRKFFLLWGAAIFSSLTVLKFTSRSKKKKGETVKMLTREGRLVEIDKQLLISSGKKINNEQLQSWVKK